MTIRCLQGFARHGDVAGAHERANPRAARKETPTDRPDLSAPMSAGEPSE